MTTVELEPVAARARTGIRAWTAQALRDVAYCAAVLVWSVAGFTVLVTGISVTASLLVLVVGVPVWIGFVHVVRLATRVDRTLAGWQRHAPVPAVYGDAGGHGFWSYTRTLTTDPQTGRDLLWLAITSVLGFTAGLVVTTAAGLVLTYVSMPLWFWAVSHPHSEYGVTNLGFFTVDTFGEAMTTTAIGLVLLPVVLLLARGCATGHAALAARLLGPVHERSDRA